MTPTIEACAIGAVVCLTWLTVYGCLYLARRYALHERAAGERSELAAAMLKVLECQRAVAEERLRQLQRGEQWNGGGDE